MDTEQFINMKAFQLANYSKAFLNNKIDYNEMHLYLWDTLEEWQQLNADGEAQSDIERVFWHLLYTFDECPTWVLYNDNFIRQHLQLCCDFLFNGGKVPVGCIGIRP